MVSVTVENVEAQTDLEDVSVELYLYNVDENKKIDKWKSDDEFDLDDGEEEDFDFEFEIPNDENIGSNDKYVLFAVATGQDDDDDYCTIATEEIDIERETHDVLIKQVTVTPSEIEAGGSVSLVVEVENIGTKKEEDVYVRIRESELGLDEQSAYFTLDKYSKSRNDAIQRFMIDVPENAEEKSYQIEVLVYFDDGDETVSKFAMLKVKAVEVPEVPVADASVSTEGVQTTVTEGSSFSIPVKVKNLASETITFEVKLANVEAWAEEVSPMTLTLAEGQESTVFVYVKPKTGVAGMHSATVNVESGGNIVATTTLSFNVEESAEETSGITGFSVMNIAKSTTFWWIVGDIVLIVIAIFFIRMLFSKRQ